MWSADAVVGETWFGCFVHLADERGTVHTGAWTRVNGCFGVVVTDCGAEGVGYLDGFGVADCTACRAPS